MANTFVFRIDPGNEYIKHEFEQGRLRQGWGNSGTDLKQPMDEWVERYCRFAGTDNKNDYRRRYKNLSIMLEIKAGDILIIPKLPDSSKFTVCRAAGEYSFLRPEGV